MLWSWLWRFYINILHWLAVASNAKFKARVSFDVPSIERLDYWCDINYSEYVMYSSQSRPRKSLLPRNAACYSRIKCRLRLLSVVYGHCIQSTNSFGQRVSRMPSLRIRRIVWTAIVVVLLRENTQTTRNYTMSDVSLKQSCQRYQFIIYTVIVGLLVIVGIVGNSLTFVVFWKGKFNKSTSFLFMCLSLTDSAVLVSTSVWMPLLPFEESTRYTQYFWNVYPYIFVYVLPVCFMAQMATVWVTVLITINRFINVCVPLRASQWCTFNKVNIQLAVVLLFAILYNIPKFAEFQVAQEATDNGTSLTTHVNVTMYWFDYTYQLMYNTVLYAIFNIVLPICILAVLNIRLINALKAHRRMQMQMHTQDSHNEHSMTLVLAIIVIVQIVCQLPSLVTRILWTAAPTEAYYCGGYMFYMVPITNMLVVLNSAVNFLVYIMFNKCFLDVLMEKVFKRQAVELAITFDDNGGSAVKNARPGGEERSTSG